MIDEGSGRGSIVTGGRRCQTTTPTTNATSPATPKATRRRERPASEGEASQSVLVFFSLRAAGAGVTTFTRTSSVGWSPVTGGPGLIGRRLNGRPVIGLSQSSSRLSENLSNGAALHFYLAL